MNLQFCNLKSAMHRDLSQLTAGTFDVLVVGGGIYGLTIAYDAAQRGLSVALIDRGRLRQRHRRSTICGRFTAGFATCRRSIWPVRASRSASAGRWPRSRHMRSSRMPFALPLYRSLTRGRLAMRAGFALDRLVAFDRNRGVVPSHCDCRRDVSCRGTPRCRAFPGLRRQG